MKACRKDRGRRGVALITTLLITALLVAVVVEFNRIAIADISITGNHLEEKRLFYTAVSGVEAVEGLLLMDAVHGSGDTLLDEWNKGDQYFRAASSIVEEGEFSGEIVDEERKIPVNGLVDREGKLDPAREGIWRRLLMQPVFGLTEVDVSRIIHGVKDWIDPDDEITGLFGAEDSSYRREGIRCRNGPMESLEEMLLIKGMNPEIFYGDRRREGIRDYFTVYGGSVNINTAPVPVLMALSDLMSRGIAEEMDEFRREAGNRTLLREETWYRRFWPYERLLPESILGASSAHFRIRIKARVGKTAKEAEAVIKRSERESGIIYWRET